eukprot:CAMPEP_0114584022 /NCGR_PEP_ID=MMETSP0125-20121206/7730_1 /TAXON_ID=485358 ORGANISM="Aristerostoma sp., Strain ATCC 50986" /NCGR_SAMPLE_ID=MMETSP0125 /ASSEMBLY_ACC=CAM_ASM_000245 /LENGTH=75 /DNA_ID=CAMNT_0001778013 /DNA_START=694 /DNA_END=921 /DNA_ORIENTATION=+
MPWDNEQDILSDDESEKENQARDDEINIDDYVYDDVPNNDKDDSDSFEANDRRSYSPDKRNFGKKKSDRSPERLK